MKRFAVMPQAFNMYSYVGNNPIIYTDPTGESIFGYLGGNAILSYLEENNYTITHMFFQHALKDLNWGNFFINDFNNRAENLHFGNDSEVASAIKNSNTYKNEILGFVKKQLDQGILTDAESVRFSSEADGNDLYFSFNKVNYEFNASQNDDGSYNVNISITDTYDFTEFKLNDLDENTFKGALANDIATTATKLGELKTYDVEVNTQERIERRESRN